jgi:hypothetical protein
VATASRIPLAARLQTGNDPWDAVNLALDLARLVMSLSKYRKIQDERLGFNFSPRHQTDGSELRQSSGMRGTSTNGAAVDILGRGPRTIVGKRRT